MDTDRATRGRRRDATSGRFVVAGCVAVLTVGAVAAVPGTVASAGAECPALYALGVQGTGESSPDAAPTTDTGMLSTVFRPLLANAGDIVAREYIPYEASFGGATPGGSAPYAQSVAGGLDRLRDKAREITQRCSSTQLALVGYSQGANVVSMFAQDIGSGGGGVPADRVAAVALFADPTRNPGASVFPGAPDKQRPDPAPGTSGGAVAAIPVVTQSPVAGGGIGPQRDLAANFGPLTGRVATFCVPADLACDAPDNAPILRAVANVAGQSELSGGDPVASLSSIAQALAFTAIKTATAVVNEDIQGQSLSELSITPKKSLSRRIAEASDPRTPVDVNAAVRALMKVGTIGLNAVVTVARTMLTPSNIAELTAVGLSDPAAALALFGQKLAGAVVQLVPPATSNRLVQQAFQVVTDNVTDNSDLLNTATWVRYWDTIQRHTAYGSTPVAANGETAVQYVADWFAAAAKDIAGAGQAVGK
ncbi:MULTISPECIES: cutinase family protein [unclassified Nocardia]|uniref:cutinase family protein n=1 Tax=unclassified Nocardia TaxID=2637762 RepID=UPI0027DFB1F5|nr:MULTISPECIES: cutinase family protein [unclassified Nocardia]